MSSQKNPPLKYTHPKAAFQLQASLKSQRLPIFVPAIQTEEQTSLLSKKKFKILNMVEILTSVTNYICKFSQSCTMPLFSIVMLQDYLFS